MKAFAAAALLGFFSYSGLAVTETWDGNTPTGTGDANFTTGFNWADDTAPAPPGNIATLDLVFGGTLKPSPVVNTAYSANSVTFNNTAGAFSLVGGLLSIGTGGIVNNDTQSMAFSNQISFGSVANSTVNAAAGGLTFAVPTILPTGNLIVTGSFATLFNHLIGTSTVTKQGSGTMTLLLPAASYGFDLTISNGTVATSADGSTDSFSASSTIAIDGTSIFNVNESLTLDGAQLTRATSAAINLAAGKTLTIQNGGDMMLTGNFLAPTSGTITVTGTGSTFSVTNTVFLRGGITMNITAGADVTVGTTLSVGEAGVGTLNVGGVGSTLMAATLSMTQTGGTGTAAFTNGATGSFNFMSLNDLSPPAPGGMGTLSILSGATITTAQFQQTPSVGGASFSTLVSGSGSSLTVSGSGTFSLGTSVTSTSALFEIENNAIVATGTGNVAVRQFGALAIAGGHMLCNGDFSMRGQFSRDNSGTFTLAAGRQLLIESGGDANFTGSEHSERLNHRL